MNDYTGRYGLDFNPFIKNTHDIVIETQDYREITYRLNYLLNNKGFGTLTGGSGCGKTTVVRSWSKELNPSLYKVIYTSLSTLTISEFYRHIASELGLEAMHRKADNFKNIQTEISRYSIEKRITPVIIIDEANHINNAVLTDLKMLFGFEMDSRDRAILLLVGLPQLNNTLRLAANEPLRQRITMNYNLDSLTREEAHEYIKGKLSGAKCIGKVFDENAMEAVVNAANGIPRLLNKICNQSLIIADSKKAGMVDSDIVMLAVNETELG